MTFTSLASSSHGNAYLVSDGTTTLLIECGLPKAKLRQLVGFNISELAACLVSHEHKDHAKSADELISKGLTVYMSEGTADALETEGAELIEAMEQFTVGSFDIVPFTTFHDAAEPLGFLIKSRADCDVLAFATDTVNLRYKFPHLNILAIEANYDKDILERSEKLPEKVKHRIANTHMEIDTLCDYLKSLDLSQCREIHLLHLSDGMSHEGRFVARVRSVVPSYVKVSACGK